MTAQPTTKKTSPILIIIGVIAGICVLCVLGVFALSAMGLLTGSTTSIPVIATDTPSSAVASEPTNIQEVINSRCVPASAQQMESIRAGIKDIEESNDVLPGFAVRSNDLEQVWFVAAEITGSGIPANTVGIWAIGGELETPGLVLSVDGFAKAFSPYPDASTTDAQITQFDDGAQEALSCAKG
jgi:hypothetical protein